MSIDFLQAIGDKFRTVRRYRNIGQAELAETLGISRQHLSNIEKGKHRASMEMFVQIAEALGCELVINLKLKEIKQ